MPHPSEPPELELRDYLRVLRRRKGTVLLAVLVVIGVALAVAEIQTPVYQAKAEILLQQGAGRTLFNPNTGQPNDPTRAVQTQIQVIQSSPVKEARTTRTRAIATSSFRQW